LAVAVRAVCRCPVHRPGRLACDPLARSQCDRSSARSPRHRVPGATPGVLRAGAPFSGRGRPGTGLERGRSAPHPRAPRCPSTSLSQALTRQATEFTHGFSEGLWHLPRQVLGNDRSPTGLWHLSVHLSVVDGPGRRRYGRCPGSEANGRLSTGGSAPMTRPLGWAVASVLLLARASATPDGGSPPHWGYTGEESPAHWGDI